MTEIRKWIRTHPASNRYLVFCVTVSLMLQVYTTVRG